MDFLCSRPYATLISKSFNWKLFQNFIKILPESSNPTSDSTESSFSSATSTTSTSTVVCNFNALKPKNNQTHSVSQTSLQSTGAVSTKQSSPCADKSSKCQLLQYANLTPSSIQKDQQNPPASHGTIKMFPRQRAETSGSFIVGFR